MHSLRWHVDKHKQDSDKFSCMLHEMHGATASGQLPHWLAWLTPNG